MDETLLSEAEIAERRSAWLVAHLSAKRVLALFALLHLQYNQEGHMDEIMVALLEQTMFELEEECAQAAGMLKKETIPF